MPNVYAVFSEYPEEIPVAGGPGGILKRNATDDGWEYTSVGTGANTVAAGNDERIPTAVGPVWTSDGAWHDLCEIDVTTAGSTYQVIVDIYAINKANDASYSIRAIGTFRVNLGGVLTQIDVTTAVHVKFDAGKLYNIRFFVSSPNLYIQVFSNSEDLKWRGNYIREIVTY